MAARYKPHLGSSELAKLLKSPRLSAALVRQAHTIAARYKASVPRRTGALASSVYVRTTVGGAKHDRLVARVEATARNAAPLEFGWTDRYGHPHPGRHYMRRAARGGS